MAEINLNGRSKIAKNVAVIGVIIFIIGLILYLLFSYVHYDTFLLWSLLLVSFGFAFVIGGGIKYWMYIKKFKDMNKNLEDTRG